jgi:hypothetical protein
MQLHADLELSATISKKYVNFQQKIVAVVQISNKFGAENLLTFLHVSNIFLI